MLPERRAVLFDLDDTLYPYAWFRASGFTAVAAYLEHIYRRDATAVLETLFRLCRGESRGRELQGCLAEQELASSLIDEVLATFREHAPAINLPAPAAKMLKTLRGDGWLTGIVTNGTPDIQQRKIASLGLKKLVDVVIYAEETGDRTGKPAPHAFLKALRYLDVPAAAAVFVGNDERCDIAGAQNVGMPAVLCTVWTENPGATTADAIIDRLVEVPDIAAALLKGDKRSHAA